MNDGPVMPTPAAIENGRVLLYTGVERDAPGGVANVVRRLAEGLRARGRSVAEAWVHDSPTPRSPDTLPKVRPRRWRGVPTPGTCLGAAQFAAVLAERLRQTRPAIVNVHYVHPNAIAMLRAMSRVFGYRLVVTAHGSDVFESPPGERGRLATALSGAHALTAVTPSLAEATRRACEGSGGPTCPVQVIRNGVDLDYWTPADLGADLTPRGEVRSVVAVGALRRVKGHDLLVRAWSRLGDRIPAARLTVLGDGPERDALHALAKREGVADRVAWRGAVDRDGVRDALRSADLFVLPSRSEAMPLALMEAMACGTPAVATRVGGVEELLGADSPAVVDPESIECLAGAIAELAEQPGRLAQRAHAGRKRVAAFAAGEMVRAYDDLFARLCERARIRGFSVDPPRSDTAFRLGRRRAARGNCGAATDVGAEREKGACPFRGPIVHSRCAAASGVA